MTRGWHVLSDVDPEQRTGTCAVCGPRVRLAFHAARGRWRCWTKKQADEAARVRVYDADQRRRERQRRYGLTAGEHDALLEQQGGVCAICGQPCRSGNALSIDHSHADGRVRGLLCSDCNRAIGLLGDDPRRALSAAAYLSRHDGGPIDHGGSRPAPAG